MENNTGIKDAISAVWGVFKTLFSNQKDNQMLKDLKIVKGIKSGIGYLIYLTFVLPAKILTFFLKPSWSWVHFTQRHLVSPMFEVDALTGSESPSRLLGEIYEKNLNYFKIKGDSGVDVSTLKPSISVLERIMVFAKVRVILTLLLFALGAMALYEYFDLILDIGSLIVTFVGGTLGYIGMSNPLDTRSLAFGLSMGAILGYALYTLGGILIVYLAMFALRFLTESIKSIMYADRQMMMNFVDDSIHYTVAKSIDLYGEETALRAYDLLIENVVIDKVRYTTDEPHYKRLEVLKEVDFDTDIELLK